MKINNIAPYSVAGDLIVQFSSTHKVDKTLTLTVPVQYRGLVYINEKLMFRVEPCNELNLVKEYGKELIGDNIKVAYVMTSNIPLLPWGFGNIEINNEKKKEAYRMGANGKYSIEVEDYGRLINALPANKNISVDDIREKVLSGIRSVGTPILNKMFAKSDISAFEANIYVNDFKKLFVDALASEKYFKDLGVKVVSFTVDGIHINDEDIENLRNKVNRGDVEDEEEI